MTHQHLNLIIIENTILKSVGQPIQATVAGQAKASRAGRSATKSISLLLLLLLPAIKSLKFDLDVLLLLLLRWRK